MTSYHEPAPNAPPLLTPSHRVRGVKPPGELEIEPLVAVQRRCRLSVRLACPIESRIPVSSESFPSQSSRISILPLNDSTKQSVAKFDSSCLHEMIAVVALPRALGEALSSSLDSLSRSARHAAAFPGFAAYPQSLRPYRRRIHGYDGFKR